MSSVVFFRYIWRILMWCKGSGRKFLKTENPTRKVEITKKRLHWLRKFSIRSMKLEGFWKRRRKLGCGLSSPKKTLYPRSNRRYEINTSHVGPEMAENSAKRSAKASISILLTTSQKTLCKNYKTHISPIVSQENFSCLKWFFTGSIFGRLISV